MLAERTGADGRGGWWISSPGLARGTCPCKCSGMEPAWKRPRGRVITVRYGARLGRDFDVYIGRGGHGYPPSPFANPFAVGTPGVPTRSDAIAAFRESLRGDPALVARIRAELPDKVLGCWCAPEPCHGDVLVAVAHGADP